MNVPPLLRKWFILHFALDIIFAFPLIFMPEIFMSFWGFADFNNLTARLTGAALTAIGVNSFLMSGGGAEAFNAMLTLKIIWSLSAILGIIMTIADGGPGSLYLFLGIFTIFSLVWIFYKRKLMRVLKAAPEPLQP